MGIFDKAIISLTLVLLNSSFNVLPKCNVHFQSPCFVHTVMSVVCVYRYQDKGLFPPKPCPL